MNLLLLKIILFSPFYLVGLFTIINGFMGYRHKKMLLHERVIPKGVLRGEKAVELGRSTLLFGAIFLLIGFVLFIIVG